MKRCDERIFYTQKMCSNTNDIESLNILTVGLNIKNCSRKRDIYFGVYFEWDKKIAFCCFFFFPKRMNVAG